MNLVIDSGNTLTKLALYQGMEMLAFNSFSDITAETFISFCESESGIKNAILSSVKEYPSEIEEFLRLRYNTVFLDHTTPIPVSNRYRSPETLGKDRLAAVVGASRMFPGCDILVVDAGTAITYDLITGSGEYLGGGISPGISIRYRGLHTFTGRLPLLNSYDDAELIGADTSSGIASGVLNGTLAEMEGIIQRYQKLYTDLKIILTGGDFNYFDKRLKIKTFAAPNLVLEGLNLILRFNLETQL